MEQTGFTARMARALEGPLDAACAVRAPGTTITSALCAGLGAAIGSVAAGSALFAGLGGALGVVVGYCIVWLRVRGSGLGIAMALVLRPDRLDLLRLNAFGTRPVGVARSYAYADLAGVTMRSKLLEVRIELQTADGPIKLDGGKRGVGAAPPVIEQLQRRIAA
jgi:hypothetical protein